MKLVKDVLDFFLPRICISCEEKLKDNEKCLCFNCFSSIKRTDKDLLSKEYDRKFKEENIITDFVSLFLFEKDKALQSVIHDLKYNGNIKAGIYLGELAGKNFYKDILNWKPDFIIPVPLYHLKKAERGYNQSYYISKAISKIVKIPVETSILKRIRYTQSQTELNLEERKVNVFGAFSVKNKSLIRNKNFLIVDDVITTGATISECGKVLIENGASKIYALSIALAS